MDTAAKTPMLDSFFPQVVQGRVALALGFRTW